MKISIVIPIYNEESNILNLLNSIKKNNYKNLEIIIVDDGSTDNTRKKLKKFPYIKYFFQNKSGVARARNYGIKKSTGDLILLFDGDVILKKNTLSNFVKYFRANQNLVILQGLWEKKYLYKTNFITSHLLLKLNYNFEYKSKFSKKIGNFKGIHVDELMTGCLGFRKKIKKFFHFNEKYKNSGGEEFELGYEISKKFNIYYTPKIKIYHKFEGYLETLRRIYFRSINYSILTFKKKNISNKSNVSVPKRDFINLIISFLILINFFLIFIFIQSIYIFIFLLLLFVLNNWTLLKYILKNKNFLFLIKSILTEIIVSIIKSFSVLTAVIKFYLFKNKNYKW